MSGLYIHVPFCQKRCFYCSFYSTTHGKRERDLYTDALIREMDERSKDYPRLLSTIYLGGGTPSQLDNEELTAIFSSIHRNFEIEENAEITIEVNPDDVTPELVRKFRDLGINRVSMGVQSFNDDILKTINRRHTSEQALQAIEIFHREGIDNISIDLIYGLPGQSEDIWRNDLSTAFSLPVTHLSSYALSIEEGTPLYILRARGEITEVDDDTFLKQYEMLIDAAHQAGFEHYEISNFARKGYRSRHNSSYWCGKPYLGLGPGAHSYDGASVRHWNNPDLSAYIAYWKNDGNPKCFSLEKLTATELYDEIVMTRLRTCDGLPFSLLTEKQRGYILSQAKPHLTSGNLVQKGEKLVLTRSGLFVSDDIMSDLMWDVDLPL